MFRRLTGFLLLVLLAAVPTSAQVVTAPQPIGASSARPFQNLFVSGSTISGSATTSFLDISGVWNTTGAPTAVKLNVTDTASLPGSLLFDAQVGGVSKASVKKDGVLTTASTIVSGGSVSVAATSAYKYAGRSEIYSSADGVIDLKNNAGTSFTRLNFGGTTSSSPGIRVEGSNGLAVVAADNSAYKNMLVGALNTQTASPASEGYFSVTCSGTSPARTCVVQIYDQGTLVTIASNTR